jgi:hypothetical protein
MTNRLHVLSDGQRTRVLVTDEASVTAAVKRRLLMVAEQAGLIEPYLVSTSPIQSPDNLKRLGLEPWRPLRYAADASAASRIDPVNYPGVTLLTGYLEIEEGNLRHHEEITRRLREALIALNGCALDEAWVLQASCGDYVGHLIDDRFRRHDQVTIIVTGDARDETQFKRYVLPALLRDSPVVRLTIVGGEVSQPATGVRTGLMGLPMARWAEAA